MSGHISTARTKEDILTAYCRNALLKAAGRVFAECAFEAATVERVAQEADVAKGTTYLYYRSKQSIYDAALGHGLTELEARTEAAMKQAPTLRAAITASITKREDPGSRAAAIGRAAGSSRRSRVRSAGARSAASMRRRRRSRFSTSPAGS